ncbi:MAG: hypothetical protein Q7V17_20995 [Afipia sp.]|nr:hypothetical protein [Afipia sp.]
MLEPVTWQQIVRRAPAEQVRDSVKPSVNERMEEFREIVRGSKDILDVEEKGFRGLFEYVAKHPGFYRVLNEAAAPAAFDEHISNLAQHYTRALKRSRTRGEIQGYDERELEVVAFVLMAARSTCICDSQKAAQKQSEFPTGSWMLI